MRKMAPQVSVVGPWGGQGGKPWTYVPNGPITHISITYGDNINTIRFASQNESGNTELSDQFGEKVGGMNAEIDIDVKVEKLSSISGTIGEHGGLVKSLSFTTNKNKSYGPFGTAEGTAFSYKFNDVENISGFHGRSGWYLDAIGVYVKPKGNLSVGPWGGQGGKPWTYVPNGPITHISITYGDIINTIRVASQNESGNTKLSDQFGEEVGGKNAEIDIDAKVEKLSGISGTIGEYFGVLMVTSLSFTTNKNKSYGPFGTGGGTAFSFLAKDQGFVGFHGRSGKWLDAIGVYLKPLAERNLCVGPWGSQEPGNQWTYEPKGVISNISVTHDDAIYSIRFTSQDDKGNVEHSETFGWTSGSKSDEIVIDIKNEKLNFISGTVGVKSGYVSITSLTFSTDKKKTFGPFGTPIGTAFSLLAKDQGFVGFHGRSRSWLDAIGVYLKPLAEQRFGQWGSQNQGNGWGSQILGYEWSYVPKGAISHVSITHNDAINSIRFTSQDDEGNLDHSATFGRSTGTKSSEIGIDIKKEKLNNISGTTDASFTTRVVTSLSFSTDKNTTFGPFGTAIGTAFSARMNNGTLSGFFGRSGTWVEAIGVVVKPTE